MRSEENVVLGQSQGRGPPARGQGKQRAGAPSGDQPCHGNNSSHKRTKVPKQARKGEAT